MNYNKVYGFFESSNGCDQIAYYIYSPTKPVQAVLQLSHGMNEYVERYEEFITFLCVNGIAVIGNDHLGHGNSADCDDHLGYFAIEKGWQYIIKDLAKVTMIAVNEFPGLPLFLLGHSMGAIIARAFMAKYACRLSGVILLGTTPSKKLADAGIILAKYLCKTKGVKYRPSKIQRVLLELSNFKVATKRTNYDWICSDSNVVTEYLKDKKCNFEFTASAYLDLLYMQVYISQKSWYLKIPKLLPVLILSGAEDPVGNFGEGPKELFYNLSKSGSKDVSMTLYEGKRHEIINETNKYKVYHDILYWIKEKIQ